MPDQEDENSCAIEKAKSPKSRSATVLRVELADDALARKHAVHRDAIHDFGVLAINSLGEDLDVVPVVAQGAGELDVKRGDAAHGVSGGYSRVIRAILTRPGSGQG